MSFETLLVHRATVQTRTGVTDRFGQPTNVGWRDKATGIPCRLRSATAREPEKVTLSSREIVEVTHILYLKPETVLAIDEDDRVLIVIDPADEKLAEEMRVLVVKRVSRGEGGIHHLELKCAVVRG